VRAGVAVKPTEYTWRQLAGAGALAGIGFTMSLFIAGQASATDFSAAKIAVFAASTLSAAVGTALLWEASRHELFEEAPQSGGARVSLSALRRPVNRRSFDDSTYRYDSSSR